MFRKVLKSESGSSSVVGFMVVLPLAILITINPLYMLFDTIKYIKADAVVRKCIVQMETQGGLTPEGYSDLVNKLAQLGFRNINVEYTPYPVDFGDSVYIKVTAQVKANRVSFFGGLVNDYRPVRFGTYESISKKSYGE